MNEQRKAEAAPSNPALAARLAEICKRFRADWQQKLAHSTQAAIEPYLRDVNEPERTLLRVELESIVQCGQQRLAQAEGEATAVFEADHREAAPADTQHAEALRDTDSIAPDPAQLADTADFSLDLAGGAGEPALDPSGAKPKEAVLPATLSWKNSAAGLGSTPQETVAQPPDAASPEREMPGALSGTTTEFTPANPAAAGPADKSGSRLASGSQFFNASVFDDPGPPGGGEWPSVAGYQLLGELGRGGMGVVYKARQRGLRRLVALKMVLAGAHVSERHLLRFQTEAEAVARLQHANIVQIYEVGEEGGLPFFSLELVDGGSLDKKFGGQAQPAREAAQLTETLARTMHFAHGQGILHRDLKPGNVLLSKDGVPKITDFGLAKRLEEGDASSTRTGTIMGTPSYMSPEQASGLVHELTPLSDLYSLGAMLYEFLTGRPPFLGANPMDTVIQVTKQEAIPPSRLQPSVPRDLETICLKCLQKEPGKRYASCFELAEDLHRFLAGEPIHARPVGQLERLWRWGKRNPRIAAMTAAIFVLLAGGAVVSTVAAVTIARERNQKELERQAAEDARNVATEQVVLALDTVKTLIHKVQDQLENAPRTQALKKALLQTAAEGLEQVSQRAKGSTSNEVAIAFAAVRMKMGLVYRQLGETEEAFKHVLESHRINEEQAKAQPDSDRAKSNLAASYTVLAEMSLEMRRDLAASLDYYQKALKLREELYQQPHHQEGAPKPKSIKQGLAETYIRVGATVLRKGDPARARDYFLKALQLREELAADYADDNDVLQDLARSYHAVGEMCLRLQQTDLGKQYFGKCLKLRERLFQANPNDLKLKLELARWCGTLGELAERSRDYPEALRHYQRSVDLNRELVEIDPKNVDYQRDLGTAYYQLATAYLQVKDTTAADKYFRECLKIRQARADAEPQNSRRQMELIGVLPHCGEHVKAAAAAEKLRHSKPKDQEILIAIGCCYACCAAVPEAGQLRQHYADKSLEALNQSVALGFKDLSFFETDPDLDPVRKQPGFLKLLEKLKGH
ncbi:MAG TPA: protein kinase [Gemmataceae bacterium]|jgi:serine/threonine-protein kinase|nr:protein kinase [Gemmataceae bacterium]